MRPVEVAEFERTRIWFNFDDAGNGDGDSTNVAATKGVGNEVAKVKMERLGESGGARVGGEFETLETETVGREESEHGFGAADVDS